MKLHIRRCRALVMILVFPAVLAAQVENRVAILNNLGSIPFVDGKTVVEEVVFEGLPSRDSEDDEVVSQARIEDAWRQQRIKISVGDTFSGAFVARAVRVVREVLEEDGFVAAAPRAFGQLTSKTGMRLIFDLRTGNRPRVTKIEFVGNDAISSDDLSQELRDCLGADWRIFRRGKYAYFTKKCVQNLYWSRGFLKARVGGLKPVITETGIILTAPVDENERYRIGTISVSGVSAFKDDEIRGMLGLKAGDVADGPRVREFVFQSLKRRYEDLGYILFDADFEPLLIPAPAEGGDGTVDLALNIYEGKKFTIRSIYFKAGNFTYDGRFDTRFPIRSGDVFNRSAIEQGLLMINEDPYLCSIDFDQDVELRTNDEGWADVVIYLKHCD